MLYNDEFEKYGIPKVVYTGRSNKKTKRGDIFFLKQIYCNYNSKWCLKVIGRSYDYSLNSFKYEDGSDIKRVDFSFFRDQFNSMSKGDIFYNIKKGELYICVSIKLSKYFITKPLKGGREILINTNEDYLITESLYKSVTRSESLDRILGQ